MSSIRAGSSTQVLVSMTERQLIELLADVVAEYDRRAGLLSRWGAACQPITADILRRMPPDVQERAEHVFARRAARRRITA